MGKDKTGKFHPGKGKPSGINKGEGLGLHPTPPEKLEQYSDLSDKYTQGADVPEPGLPFRHPNRNTSKGQVPYKAKENTEESNKSKNETFTEVQGAVVPEELPGILSRELFAELASYSSGCCVSVFFPTHKAGVEVNEHFDPIIFKNALQDIANKLKEKDIDQVSIEKMLEPGYELVRNDAFWRNLSAGLAVFLSDGFFKYIKMPLAPSGEIVTDTSFYVSPLVPVMTTKEYFYLLVISKKQAKIFRADAFGMEYLPIEEIPNVIEEVTGPDKDDETTLKTGGRGGTGGANFHGIGGGNNDDKTKMATYFEAVDDVIWKQLLNKETAPLLLAGVEYLIPIYKSACDYKFIWEDALTGSHEHEDISSLYPQARAKMEPYFKQRLTKALEQFGNKSATALTSSIAADIIPASFYGKVSHLFVQKAEHIWGLFDEHANEIWFHDNLEQGSEDLLDHSVVKTILNGGEVFLLDRDEMPADSVVAALMRY
ncbi:MAG: hypothetical protein WKF97_14570 [Chitinophagaceae bacterium]